MNDPVVADIPFDPVEPAVRRRHRGGLVLLVVVGLVLLLGGGLFLLSDAGGPRRLSFAEATQDHAPDAASPAPVPFDAGRVVALETEVDQLRQRVDALEKRPAAPVPQSPPAAPAAAGGAPPDAAAVIAIGTRMDALSARQDQADARVSGTDTRLTNQLHADETRLDGLASQAGALGALSDRAARLGRIQAAYAALGAGTPLGELPGGVPALQRFRTDPPPTESQLRLAFPAAARAARAAARPETAMLGFWKAMRARAAALVTIRRGDRLVVGDRQIALIDDARTALDAGDLAGSVDLLGRLDGPAAVAIADWRARAQALLDARAALARLAAG